MPRRSGASFRGFNICYGPAGCARGERIPSLARPVGQATRADTRLTNRTLHHQASLDQTEEGPVGKIGNGRGLQFGASGRGGPPSTAWDWLIRHHTEYGQSGRRAQKKKPRWLLPGLLSLFQLPARRNATPCLEASTRWNDLGS